ncbi:hypothetical protein [Xanthobacter autotrophicus]|uniref:hypothetical protein n=1 Tax=Xanthobacter autotrophicus TaxID=280 RepID=UPI0037269842
MNFSKIKQAGARINGGAWVKDIPVDGFADVALKVRGANNPDARRLRDSLVREASDGRKGGLSPDQADAINGRIIAETILVGWNLTDDAGAPVPATQENVAEFLADPDIGPLLREAVSWASAMVGSRGVDEIEAAAKN